MLLEASLPLGDTRGIELEPVLRSEVLKASHFLVFLSVPTPDSLWPAHIFSTCQTQKRGFTPFPFCTWRPVPIYISWSWWVSQGGLFSCACPLCHFPGLFNPSVAPGVWPSPPYAAPHNGPWCLTSLLLLWGVAAGQSEPSPNHCRIWRNKTVVLCTSVWD